MSGIIRPTLRTTLQSSISSMFGRGAAAPSGDGSLQDVVPSAVFDLDATQEASYPGSGTTWANLVAAPYDGIGSGQTAYDTVFGNGSTTTTYPTFNGPAGDSAAYFSFDGGDYFTFPVENTDFLKNLHKNGGQSFTVGVALRTGASVGDIILFANTALSSANPGMVLYASSSVALVRLTANNTSESNASMSVSLSPNTDYLILMGFDVSGTPSGRIWVNSPTPTDVSAFSPSIPSTTDDPNFPYQIGAAGSGSTLFSSGTRLYWSGLFNEILDDTKVGLVKTALEARHGRTYG